jgi:ribosomal protein S18 acetylase RimI-like enzyme
VDARVDATMRLFQARGLPFSWCTGPSTRPAGLGKHLLARGFVYAGDEPGMAIDLLALSDDLPAPPGLRIERVRDAEALRGWFHIFALGFARPDFARSALLDIEIDLGLGHHRRRLYLGSLAGEPVATSLLFLGAGVAGIYGVSTLPRARRRGIGTAMTLTPLVEARAAGYRIGVLHASRMGVGVYRRLGFQEYCRLGFYGWTGERRR